MFSSGGCAPSPCFSGGKWSTEMPPFPLGPWGRRPVGPSRGPSAPIPFMAQDEGGAGEAQLRAGRGEALHGPCWSGQSGPPPASLGLHMGADTCAGTPEPHLDGSGKYAASCISLFA